LTRVGRIQSFAVGLGVTALLALAGLGLDYGPAGGRGVPAWPLPSLLVLTLAGALSGTVVGRMTWRALLVGHLVAVAGTLVLPVLAYLMSGYLTSFLPAHVWTVGAFLSLLLSMAALAAGHAGGAWIRLRHGRRSRSHVPRQHRTKGTVVHAVRQALPLVVAAGALSAGAAAIGVAVPPAETVVRVVVSDDGITVEPTSVRLPARVVMSMRGSEPRLVRGVAGDVMLWPAQRDKGGQPLRSNSAGRYVFVLLQPPPGTPTSEQECRRIPEPPGCSSPYRGGDVIEQAALKIEQ
jgi:hypothetical protein